MATNPRRGNLQARKKEKREKKKRGKKKERDRFGRRVKKACITRVPAERTRHTAFLHRDRKSGARAVKSCTGILGGRDAVPTFVQAAREDKPPGNNNNAGRGRKPKKREQEKWILGPRFLGPAHFLSLAPPQDQGQIGLGYRFGGPSR